MNFTTACLLRAYSRLNNGILCLAAIILLASCTKPEDGYLNSNSGNNLMNLNQTDTISLDMVTEYVPFLANSANLSADILGTINDPFFGRTTAGVYTQVVIGPNAGTPAWTPGSSLDSLVLTLKVSPQTTQLDTNSFLGNHSFSGQIWHLYKMANGFGTGSNGTAGYPSDTSFKAPLEIGNGLVSYRSSDSTLRLSLKKSAISQIFRDSLFDTTGNSALFTDPTEFDQLMHGIYILPDSVLSFSAGAGTLAAFNLKDTNSRLTIYYDASHSWYMNMYSANTVTKRVNTYHHNYTNSIAWKNAGKPGKLVDRVYLQPMGGMKCLVKLPYLGSLVKNNMITVNQAEFIFPVLDSSGDNFAGKNPFKILLRPAKYDGNDSLLDFIDDGVDHYNQIYQTNGNAYKYLMTRYIQRILYNYRNKPSLKSYGLNLAIPPDNPNSPARVILYTQNAAKANRPKLVITYTKIADGK